jgi:DNA-binding beta-propeller fold protein YncE
VGFLPLFASTSGDGNYEYILNAGSSTLSIINATKGRVVAVYKTGLFPSWVAES